MTDKANKNWAQGEQKKPPEKLDYPNSGTGNTLPALPLLLSLEEVSREACLEQYSR